MFASRVKKKVELKDGDDVVYVTIRKLSASSLEKASDVAQGASLASLRAMGPEVAKALRETEKDKPEVKPEISAKKRYAAYDRSTVLRAGVESWTAKEKLPGALDDLDEDAANTLHREIVDLSAPAAAVLEAAEGNASGDSIAS